MGGPEMATARKAEREQARATKKAAKKSQQRRGADPRTALKRIS